MISQTKSLALTGLLIGGAVVAAWLIDPDRHHPSDMKTAVAASARDNTYLPLHDATADTDAISLERPLDPRFASILQAARDSLGRHDRASAKVLVDAILMLDRNNPQALALQRELQSSDAAPADNNKSTAVLADAQPDAQASANAKAAKKTPAPHRHRPKTSRANPASAPDDMNPVRGAPPILGETVEPPATAAAEQVSTGAERTSEHIKPAHTGSQGSDGATGEAAHSGDDQ
ncbi:hypothetical protein AB4Y32_26185 [Paraburkholderia phymatum]|uniref:Uncharacterized protein n=1 Tax=Paraburkholderia phymatum TaxID=148447 RepID=A0ACC6U6H8_9BURK